MDIDGSWKLGVILVVVLGAGVALGLGVSSLGDSAPETSSAPEPTSTVQPTDAPSGEGSSGTTPAATPSPTQASGNESLSVPNTQRYDMNTTAVALAVHERINDIRQEERLPLLEYDQQLVDIAEYHSEDMATQLYVGHVSPDNETMQDRYELFDYDCSVPKHDGTGTYATGAENVDQTFYRETIARDADSFEYYDTLDKLAAGIVKDWMTNKSQRERILTKYWQRQGIGVTAYEDAEGRIVVLATQNLC